MAKYDSRCDHYGIRIRGGTCHSCHLVFPGSYDPPYERVPVTPAEYEGLDFYEVEELTDNEQQQIQNCLTVMATQALHEGNKTVSDLFLTVVAKMEVLKDP